MLEALITSKTRIKLLLKFFLNAGSTGYLRGLETEFKESTNSIRHELNRFEEAGLLQSGNVKNRKVYKANKKHPLFGDIHRLVRRYVGINDIIDQVINHLGEPEEAYLQGDLAKGLDSEEINILIIGKHIDRAYLEKLITKASKIVSRQIRYQVMSREEFERKKETIDQKALLSIWKSI